MSSDDLYILSCQHTRKDSLQTISLDCTETGHSLKLVIIIYVAYASLYICIPVILLNYKYLSRENSLHVSIALARWRSRHRFLKIVIFLGDGYVSKGPLQWRRSGSVFVTFSNIAHKKYLYEEWFKIFKIVWCTTLRKLN